MKERLQAEEAERFARSAHEGQTDKAGEDYRNHLERVAGRMDSDGERAVAWLHDVIEDTTADAAMLRTAGFSEDVIGDVERLTRRSHESYAGYIEKLRTEGTDRAVAVKLADIADHLEHRPDVISKSLRHRYIQARKRLTKGRRARDTKPARTSRDDGARNESAA